MTETTTKDEIKQEVLNNIETARGLRHGLLVADLVFGFGVLHETASAAVSELVREGVLRIVRKSGRVNVYGVA